MDTMVTVVDAGAFLEAYTSADRMMQRPDLGVSGGGTPGRNRTEQGGGGAVLLLELAGRFVVETWWLVTREGVSKAW